MNVYVGAVGARIPRLETREKVTGQARYSDDMFPQDVIHAAMITSPYPHARILSYDVSQALAVPGVRAVITGDDLELPNRGGPFVNNPCEVRVRIAVAQGVNERHREYTVSDCTEPNHKYSGLSTAKLIHRPGNPLSLSRYCSNHAIPSLGSAPA